MVSVRLLVLSLVAALALPTFASAQAETVAPPGNSALDEYLQTVPGPSGDKRLGKPRAELSPSARQRLERRGKNGKALAAIVEGTSERPRTPPRESATPAIAGVVGSPPPRAVVGSPPPRAVADAATGDVDGDGLGLLLPGLLLSSALGIAALVILRRRSSKA